MDAGGCYYDAIGGVTKGIAHGGDLIRYLRIERNDVKPAGRPKSSKDLRN